jgi:hypothetical protein
MIADDPVKGFALRGVGTCGGCNHLHAIHSFCATRSDQLAVDFHHARIAGLDWSKLGMVTNLRYFHSVTIDQIDQPVSRPNRFWSAVNDGCHWLSVLRY